MTRKLLIAISIAMLAIAAAGCGGGDNASSETTTEATPASEWADGFCGAVTTWKDDLTAIKNDFGLDDLSQDGLESAANDLKTSTEALVDDLRVLGAPDTESGEEVKSAIDDLATTIENEMNEIETTVDEASGVADLLTAGQDVLASLETMSNEFQSTLTTIEDADVQNELQDALESSPACDEITG